MTCPQARPTTAQAVRSRCRRSVQTVSGHECAVRGWDIGMLLVPFDAVHHGFGKRCADAEYVMTLAPDRAVAIVDHRVVQTGVRNLAHVALGRAQDVDPFLDQLLRWQRLIAGVFEPDESSEIVQILTKNKLVALGHDRREATYAERKQLFSPAGVIYDIDHHEIDMIARKKLLRFEAAGSPRLGEQNKLIGNGIHLPSFLDQNPLDYSTAGSSYQASMTISPRPGEMRM